MILWRIAAETREYSATDLSGAGAGKNPGRWNEAGRPVVYCAPTIAMAVLETAAHVRDAGLPLNRYLVRLDVPEALWSLAAELSADALPATWDAIPAGAASAAVGTAWLRSSATAILLVPSAIVPEERAALINPSHPDAKRVTATAQRRFDYNRLFRGP